MLEAMNHPDMLPIPEYVMNDVVRTWEPQDDSAYFFTFANGDYENLVLHDSVPLRERELSRKQDFASWLK